MPAYKARTLTPSQALPGRDAPVPTDRIHAVLNTPLKGPYPEGMETVVLAMGCFWGVDRLFWQQEGVYVTAAGYIGGYTPNPTYKEVCSGLTGHTEAVQVVFDPKVISFEALMALFWEYHDPTQGDRQGNDVGSQYRSAIFTRTPSQYQVATRSRDVYQGLLNCLGKDPITTEIHAPGAPHSEFYFAEDYHQGYLEKNPGGYCNIKSRSLICA